MSESKAKKERKLKMMTEEADPRSVADDMAKSISKMYEDRDEKVLSAQKHLMEKLNVTSDKYRTANGVMAALTTVRQVAGDRSSMLLEEEISMAKGIANEMAIAASDMAFKASILEPENMDKLCEGFYKEDFSKQNDSASGMVLELMILQLCQNVGPDAGDIVDFIKQADQEIDKARESLRTYCKENGIDFDEVCGE